MNISSKKALTQKANYGFQVCLGLYLSLIALLLTKTLWLNSPEKSHLILSIVQIMPLLLPLPGLLRKRTKSAAWLCFILCFYFISSVLATWSFPGALYEWLITFFVIFLYIASMMFIRWQGRLLRHSSIAQ